MDDLESRIYEVEQNLAREQKKLAELRAEVALRKDDDPKFDKFKGILCLFWDQEDPETGTPKGSMIRPFARGAFRPPNPIMPREPASYRFYAADVVSEVEVGHGWKHFEVLAPSNFQTCIWPDGRKRVRYVG